MGYTRCEINTRLGKVAGRDDGSVLLFDGVPYAKDNGRFRAAGRVEPWGDDVLDATMTAHAFPQFSKPLTARIDGAKTEIVQDEGAFQLSIRTPGLDRRRPVVFWIHGGGYTTGSCALPQYDGRGIARYADVVFVGVNYRLGALGNILLPGVADENLALRDLLTAFEWVVDNIGDYGGDPTQITLFGQSAGAWYATAMAACGKIDGLFERMALMSLPGTGPMPRETAARIAGSLLRILGLERPEELLEVPWQRIVDNQWTAVSESGHFGISYVTNIGDAQGADPDGVLLEEDFIGQAIERCGDKVALLDGVALHETTFFSRGDHARIAQMDRAQMREMLTVFTYDDPEEVLASYERAHGKIEGDPYWDIARITSDILFTEPSDRICAGFGRSFGYRFEYPSANPDLGACHCIDLPFAFDNLEAHGNDPMFRDNDLGEMQALARSVQAGYRGFFQTGDPGWPPFAGPASRKVFV